MCAFHRGLWQPKGNNNLPFSDETREHENGNPTARVTAGRKSENVDHENPSNESAPVCLRATHPEPFTAKCIISRLLRASHDRKRVRFASLGVSRSVNASYAELLNIRWRFKGPCHLVLWFNGTSCETGPMPFLLIWTKNALRSSKLKKTVIVLWLKFHKCILRGLYVLSFCR